MTIDAGSANAGKRRPGWVWVIGIFYFLSAGGAAICYSIILSGVVPLPPAQQKYYGSLTAIDYTITIALVVLNLSGAVFLFLLRRQAYLMFATGFVITILLTLWQIAARHWLGAMNVPGLIGAVIGWSLSLAIVLYARALVRRGVLT